MERLGVAATTAYPQANLAEGIATVIDVFNSHGLDARLAGSYGRAASINAELPSPYKGYSSTLRDIDLMIVHHDRITSSLDNVQQEAQATISSLGSIDILREDSLFSDGNSAEIKFRDITVEVDPEVLAIQERKINDVSIPTFDPMTHFHLSGVHGNMRSKDFRNLVAFGRAIRQLPTLPDETFEPFHDLYRQIESTYPLERPIFVLTEWYREYIPYELRKKLVPVMKTVKGNLLKRH
jgi:hypothetical protein